jgi:hypothetical protein
MRAGGRRGDRSHRRRRDSCVGPRLRANVTLPLPLAFWVAGAGASIVLSFVVMAIFVRERAVRDGLSAVRPPATSPVPMDGASGHCPVIRAISVLVFGATVLAGFIGEQDFIPTSSSRWCG